MKEDTGFCYDDRSFDEIILTRYQYSLPWKADSFFTNEGKLSRFPAHS